MQEAYCVIDKNGFRFTVQKSNCLQANVYLKKEIFTRFECEGNHQFGINLSLLLECLKIFGTSSGNQIALQITYAGEGHPILLQMVDGDGFLFTLKRMYRNSLNMSRLGFPLCCLFFVT